MHGFSRTEETDLTQSVLKSGCKQSPFWLDDMPTQLTSRSELPVSVDVAIVGSGYTGLHAAIETVRGGCSTLVLDAEEPGFGCSTRNGGQISTSVKPSLKKLSKKYGATRARDPPGR